MVHYFLVKITVTQDSTWTDWVSLRTFLPCFVQSYETLLASLLLKAIFDFPFPTTKDDFSLSSYTFLLGQFLPVSEELMKYWMGCF